MSRQLGYVSSLISQATNTTVGYGVATGTPAVTNITDGGITYASCSFTASSTLVVSTAGFFEVLLYSGGGGGSNGGDGRGAGSGAIPYQGTVYLPAATYTITVGAGGAQNVAGGITSISGIRLTSANGGPGGAVFGTANGTGANYRNGYGGAAGSGANSALGFAGGASNGSNAGGGGGGAGGAGGTPTAGAGLSGTFIGSALSYCAGGTGGTPQVGGSAGPANSGNGGGATNNGGSGRVFIRWRA